MRIVFDFVTTTAAMTTEEGPHQMEEDAAEA
jgi:hypothetical protein